MQNNEEKDVGWTVVSNRKGKAKSTVRDSRIFNEVARGIRIVDEVSSLIPKIYFKDAGPSGVDKGKNLMYDPSLSQEENSTSPATAFKSPKKRTRELFEEVQENSEPSPPSIDQVKQKLGPKTILIPLRRSSPSPVLFLQASPPFR
ncbi:hypothetical protein ACE6H2_023526 [Prunus campanulata]